MHRDQASSIRPSFFRIRAGSVAVLMTTAVAGIALSGWAADRKGSPGSTASPPTQMALLQTKTKAKPAADAPKESKPASFSLAYLPNDAVVVAAVRPATILKRSAAASLAQALSQSGGMKDLLGVSLERIEQATAVMVVEKVEFNAGVQFTPPGAVPKEGEGDEDEDGTGAGQPPFEALTDMNGPPRKVPVLLGTIIQTVDAKDATALGKALIPEPQTGKLAGQTYFYGPEKTGPFYCIVGGRTVIISEREDHLKRLLDAGANGPAKADWAAEWQAMEKSGADAVVLLNTPQFRETLDQVMFDGPGGGGPNPLPLLHPLWRNTRAIVLGLQLGDRLALNGRVPATSKVDAARVKDTLAAVVTLGKNGLALARDMAPGGAGPAQMIFGLADAIVNSLTIKQENTLVTFEAAVAGKEGAALLGILVPALQAARNAARRTQSQNNLKQIALAMHNYAAVNGSFPPAVLYGPDGKTPYSWRVALLPYLDAGPLFDQYKFDEAWDSPNNKKILARMPAALRDPAAPAGSTDASYFALVGEATLFSGKEGTRFEQITDGTSNTLLVVEAKRAIPWTKPEDIPYDADKPLPKLGGYYQEGFNAALADGSVRFISQTIDEKVLRALITRAGGEVLGDF
jgi:type II secretory pathway pseudopilin PulG